MRRRSSSSHTSGSKYCSPQLSHTQAGTFSIRVNSLPHQFSAVINFLFVFPPHKKHFLIILATPPACFGILPFGWFRKVGSYYNQSTRRIVCTYGMNRLAVFSVAKYQATMTPLVFRIILNNFSICYCYDQLKISYATLPCPYSGMTAKNPFAGQYFIPNMFYIQ